MGKNVYKILKNRIPGVEIPALSGQTWYDANHNIVKWSTNPSLIPNIGEIVNNITGVVPIGYYQWSGSVWLLYTGNLEFNHNIPLFLESTVDDMGVMVGFDGYLEQVEQICNFSYTQTGDTITLYNTIDTSKVAQIYNVTFDIEWGDGTTGTTTTHTGTTLNSLTKTYSTTGQTLVSISLDTPWTKSKTQKYIQIPEDLSIPNPLGTFSGFTIPYTTITGTTIDYLNDLDYTNYTGDTTFTFAGMGKSRVMELKLYGSDVYSGITTGTTSGLSYTGYTIDNLYYQDFDDGITMITGSTSYYTKETVFNQMLTRNEHFIGFINEPTIYSDIFVERGKQGVLEKTLRLTEIKNIGEFNIYGNGYYTIRKQ